MDSRDEVGSTQLRMVARFGHIDIARLLIDCDSDAIIRAPDRRTPLHYVSMYGRLHLARLLIDSGTDVDVYDSILWIPMHYLSNAGNLDIAKLLVERGANIYSQSNKEETSLHRSARDGCLASRKRFVEIFL